MNSTSTALLLIAHGSRLDEANADLDFMARQLHTRGPYANVECCYLELAQPNIEAGGDSCVLKGARRVIMVPYFLSAGIHVKMDLEEARRLLTDKYPEVTFLLCEPIGRHPLMLEIVAQRAAEADECGRSERG